MAQWLSWLERRPVTAKVESSSLFWVVMWDLSSAGRASALQAEGHRFEPCRSHSFMGGFPSGQRGQTVNLLQIASVVRIHHHPLDILLIKEYVEYNLITRGGAVWKLVGLITRRSQVQILLPQLRLL